MPLFYRVIQLYKSGNYSQQSQYKIRDGWIDRSMDGSMDGWVDEWMDQWMN